MREKAGVQRNSAAAVAKNLRPVSRVHPRLPIRRLLAIINRSGGSVEVCINDQERALEEATTRVLVA
jgi:hypothetical protein